MSTASTSRCLGHKDQAQAELGLGAGGSGAGGTDSPTSRIWLQSLHRHKVAAQWSWCLRLGQGLRKQSPGSQGSREAAYAL